MARRASASGARSVFVHPGPYRCFEKGCEEPAVLGLGFSMKNQGRGWCLRHIPKRGQNVSRT